ncbi:MAG TPA: helix-turn-helix domain-containing protein, partial [Candidatus Blautia avicola]|nr:helix-turn-helix domain-containing protein [Candidatus Blautia avicola]
NKAKGLLITDPHLKIQDIARLTGFSSVSHFITMFKRTAGVTPLQFRKLN